MKTQSLLGKQKRDYNVEHQISFHSAKLQASQLMTKKVPGQASQKVQASQKILTKKMITDGAGRTETG